MSRELKAIFVSVSFIFTVLVIREMAVRHFSQPSIVMAAPGPAPEMQRLQKFYLGTWQYTETYLKGPFAPNGGQNTGTYTSELGPGGNSLINRFHSRVRSAILKVC